MNHYETLGVERNAKPAQIKRAYRKLASTYHTDRNGGNHDVMAAINKAYETLSDPERRARYDASGEDGPRPPTLQERAENTVAQVVMQILQSDFDGNIIAELRKHFTEKVTEVSAANKKLQAKADQLRKRKTGITSKSKVNLIHVLIDEQVTKMLNTIEKNTDSVVLCKEALKLIGDYDDVHSASYSSSKNPEDELQEELANLLAQSRRYRRF